MRELKSAILADFQRTNKKSILRALLQIQAFRFIIYMRLCNYCNKYARWLYPIARLMYSMNKGTIDIPIGTSIGAGLLLNHPYFIIVNGNAKIGSNCTLNPGVVIGETAKGVPTICDNVVIMAGAKIIGNIKIGSNVIIGANSVVTKDIPDNVFVAGMPAKIIYSL